MTLEFGSNDPKQTKLLKPKAKQPASSEVKALLSGSESGQRLSQLLNAEAKPSENAPENTLRPQSLADYIGQSALKETLRISLQAAQAREEPLEHCLLYGPPGLGKTSLAMVLAEEMQAPLHLTSAPALERPRDIVGLLMALEPGSVLFIDEIHRLNRVSEEILYPAMEDFALDRMVGKGAATRVLRVPLPKFCLIGATTKAGSLSNPLRDRFGMVHRLNFYTHKELTHILLRSAQLLGVQLQAEAAELLATRSRGTPRIANRLLRRVRDVAQVEQAKVNACKGALSITEAVAQQALALFEVDELGLDPGDRALLRVLAEQFAGGPVGLEALASSLGEDTRTLEEVYEPYLLQAGLLQRTPRGRVLSPKACEHLGLSAANAEGYTPSLFNP
jgi:Holliday junction DNA helicase RuvB